MSQFNVKEKFPNLQPIHSPPSLYTVNGIGTSIYGSRDYDVETGSYVTTLCFCVLFVPLLALGAYRVADAGGGRYFFLGKEPLSIFARSWNVALLLVALTGGGWAGFQSWYNSDSARAGRKLAQADRLVEQGKVAQALPLLKSLVLEDTPKRQEATTRLEMWVTMPGAAKARPEDYLDIWRTAVELSDAGRWLPPRNTLGNQAHQLAMAIADKEPADALALIRESNPLLDDPKSRIDWVRPTLVKLQERLPGDVNVAVELAITFDWQGNEEKCQAILTPLKDKLGDTEGARILGQIAARRGEFELAYLLLTRYCQPRLSKFRAMEERWQTEIKQLHEQAIADLNTGKVTGFDYERYQRESEEQQGQMVREFIEVRLKDDPQASSLREQFASQSAVVPVALDLGMLQLQRAQNLQGDPRIAELERAEATFLAIRNVASDAPGYKLSLGKVYYWLGKQDEGKKLMDEALAAAAGDFQRRFEVAIAVREVGAETDARALAEKIYESTSEDDQKSAVARLRAALFKDVDDQIQWLQRASQTEPEVRAALSQALGNKALSEGNKEEGIRQHQLAADAYAAMPPSSATLNNGAISYQALFRVSGRKADLDQAARLLDKAAALTPDDSVLMINAGEVNLTRAFAEILEPHVYLEVLSLDSGLDVMRFLYEDAASREKIVDQIQGSQQLARAMQLLERAILLAPKRADNYDSLLGLYAYVEDAGGLKRLKQRIEDVDPDVARQRQVAIEFVQGKEREDRRKAMIGAETNCRQLYDRWQAEPASAKRDRSLAIAAGQLAAFACARQALDDRVDINEAVKFAEEGVGLVPSTGGRHRLFYALQARAHEELAAKDSEYGRFAASARSVLAPSLTLIMALDHQTLRSAILEHPDVRRTAELYVEERQKFPQTPSTWDWFLLRHTHAERAESLRAAALADECQRLSSEIQVLLYPFSVNAVCQQYARLRCASEDSKARQLWAALRETGIPVTDEILPP